MKILITGGAGFIGSHLSEALIERGDSVIALDNLSTGNALHISELMKDKRFTFVEGSILNKNLIEELIQSVDGVMHFAAAVGVRKILDDPIGSLHTNIQGSELVLTTSARLDKPTILASTSEIYGKNSEVPLTEESDRVLGSPLLSRWTYSEAKALDEFFARALYLDSNWNIKTVRLFNVVGPRQSAAYGMVIPRFVNAALLNEDLKVYGDGTQRRVFCHIKDAVQGIISLWDSENGRGESFNLGGFEEISILELAKRIIEESLSSSRVEFIPYSTLPSGFEDMERRVPDTSKLTRLTNWTAKSGLDLIIRDAINYAKVNI